VATSSSTTFPHDTTVDHGDDRAPLRPGPVSSRDAAVNDLSSVFAARSPHGPRPYGR
jgi:hypothetical protein